MFEFYERRRLRRYLFSPLTLVLLLVPVGLLLTVAWSAYDKEREAALRKEDVALRLAQAEEREAMLSGELARITSRRGAEGELRTMFDVGLPGEEIIVLVGEPASREREAEAVPERRTIREYLTDLLF